MKMNSKLKSDPTREWEDCHEQNGA
jgi:hypothetical protein